MRYLIILLFIQFNFSLFSQNEDCIGQEHLDEDKFHEVYAKYVSEGKKKVLIRHQQEYYSKNIFKELAPEKEVHPLFFDSYGSLYPDLHLFKYFKDKNFQCLSHIKYNIDDYSLFTLFRCPFNYKALSKAISELTNKEEKAFYSALLLKTSCHQEGEGCDDASIIDQTRRAEFYQKMGRFPDESSSPFQRKNTKL